MAQVPPKAVSQFPFPPRKYFHNCATDEPTPPPPPSTTAPYQMFGREYTSEDVTPSLEQVGRRVVYDPSKPPTAELRRLNAHLLQLFMRLVRSLCNAPPLQTDTMPNDELVREIEDVFINMQYLVNQMRPTQAAMDVKALLDAQTAARKAMSKRLRDSMSKAWELVSEAAGDLSRPSAQLSEACMAPLSAGVDEKEEEGMQSCKANDEAKREDTDVACIEPPSEHMLADLARIMSDPSL